MAEAVRLEELRQEYAECRGDLRHAWERIPLSGELESPGKGAYWSMTRCTRCGTERKALVSEHTGEVLKRGYEYPEGYRIDQTVTIAELRVLFRQRQERQRRRRSRK
jgi:hypothetical protein